MAPTDVARRLLPLVVSTGLMLATGAVLLAWGLWPRPVFVAAPCDGDLLRAAPDMFDETFAGVSLVLCTHTGDGALALATNRPGWGGPIAPEVRVFVFEEGETLFWSTDSPAVDLPTPGWLWGPHVPRSRVLLDVRGVTSWAPGQLEAELDAGAWEVRGTWPERGAKDR